MTKRCVPVLAVTSFLALTLSPPRDVAAQGDGAVTGIVHVRQRANGDYSLLVTVEGNRKSISGVRFNLPDKFPLSLGAAPPQWTFTQDGKTVEASGDPQTRVDLRFDVPQARGRDLLRGFKWDRPIDLQVTTPGGSRPRKIEAKLSQLPKVQTLTTLEDAVALPPQVTPGKPFYFTPLPSYTAGTWRLTGRDGKVDFAKVATALVESMREWAIAELRMAYVGTTPPGTPFDPPEHWIMREIEYRLGIAPEGPSTLSYQDQWQEELIDGVAGWEEAPKQECQQGLTGGTPQAFAGQDACVSGCFSELEKAASFLMLDGERPLVAKAASTTTIRIRIPSDAKPGPHSIGVGPNAGPGAHVPVQVLQLQGHIDQAELWKGQSTTIRFTIVGSDKPISFSVVNHTPSIIDVEAGVRQTVTTSGGVQNSVTRRVRGLLKGDFNISYSMDMKPCMETLVGKIKRP